MAKILIAEDAPHILKLLELTLKKGGHECIACSTGEQARNRITGDAPDLAILDIMMPGIDGLTLLRELKDESNDSRMPVIILTSIGQSNARMKAEMMGVDCFMTKPFSPTQLLNTIDELLQPES